VHLLGARAPHLVRDVNGAGRVGQQFNAEPELLGCGGGRDVTVCGGGRDVTVVGHEADDRDAVDVPIGQPLRDVRTGEDARIALDHPLPALRRPVLDLRVEVPALGAHGKDGCPHGELVLDHHDGHAVPFRHVERASDVLQGLVTGRVLDLQDAVEVLLLNVDHDQSPARCIHIVDSPGVQIWWGALTMLLVDLGLP